MQHQEFAPDLVKQLIETNRFVKFTGNGLRQRMGNWNCFKCGCNGETATARARKLFQQRTDGISRLAAALSLEPKTKFSLPRTLCVECGPGKTLNLFVSEFEMQKLIENFLHEHRLWKEGGRGKFETPKTLHAVRGGESTRKKKKQDRSDSNNPILNCSQQNSFDDVVLDTSFIDSFQSSSNNILDLNQNFVRSLEINVEHSGQLQSFTAPAEANFIFNQIPLNISEVEVASPTLSMKFLNDYGAQGERTFNFNLLDFFDSQIRQRIAANQAKDETLELKRFLLFDNDDYIRANSCDLLLQWTSFTVFMMHQFRLAGRLHLELTGEPAFFELQTLGSFTWLANSTSSFILNIEQHISVLQKHAQVAAAERLQLESLLEEFFTPKVRFEDLFNFFFSENYTFRNTSVILARYFFHFPDRLKAMGLYDPVSWAYSVPIDSLCQYQTMEYPLRPPINIPRPVPSNPPQSKPQFRLKINTVI